MRLNGVKRMRLAGILDDMRTRGCVDVVLGEASYANHQADLDGRLEHLVQEAEQIEAEVGLSLLKMTVGTVIWRDQEKVERESPLYFLPVRIVGDRVESTGPMEINETFLARVAAAGVTFRLEPECWDVHSVPHMGRFVSSVVSFPHVHRSKLL